MTAMASAAPNLRRVVASKALPAPRFHYSPVVIAGGFAFVAGMVGLDDKSALVGGGAYVETARILSNLKRLAAEQGWPLEHLALARVFCTDFGRFGEVNRAWEEAFAGIEPPARTSVGVAALPLGATVEIEFQFVVGKAADDARLA